MPNNFSASNPTLNAASNISQSVLRSFGFNNSAMLIAGVEIARMLRDHDQEFHLRPRVTPDVHLLKFRTVLTSREVIVRLSTRKDQRIMFRFMDHLDRFKTDGSTRDKVRELPFDTHQTNMARRLTQFIYYEVLPWLQLSPDNLRKPSIRMPVKRDSLDARSRLLPASIKIASYRIKDDGQQTIIEVGNAGGDLSYRIPMAPNLLTRLQNRTTSMYLVVFASGNHLVLDEASFLREFIYSDEIEVARQNVLAEAA